jgi:quinoprotein glucose dehydrogenase
MQKYRMGPLFTPPSYRGTMMLPGVLGGANWGGGAFDPDTGLLYVKTANLAHIARVKQPDRSSANPRASEVDADWTGDLAGTNATFHNGLPLTKPPYALLTAVDLNHGTIAWQEPFGDWPELRRNPALKDVPLPKALGVAGPQGAIVTKGGLLFIGAEDAALHAIDKNTGKDLWTGSLPARAFGNPMTYRTTEGHQFVVVATGVGANAALVAFTVDGAAATAANN